MSSLRSQLIRLAHAQPRLRPHLLPLLKQAAVDIPSLQLNDMIERLNQELESLGNRHDEARLLGNELVAAYRSTSLPREPERAVNVEPELKRARERLRLALHPWAAYVMDIVVEDSEKAWVEVTVQLRTR